MKESEYQKRFTCHDCNTLLNEKDEFMEYPVQNKDGFNFIKCKKCHKKDPVLRNYQETEVYSRCVGYMRPVKQWNPGKKAEFSDRKTYKNGERN